MPTPLLDVRSPEAARLAIVRAAEVLRGGGLVSFPTETVYGLGANALDPEAVARIFVAKGRPSNNPLIVHVTTLEEAHELVAAWPDEADLLARFWPGPLTLVLPRSPMVPDIITAGGPTVAVRIPATPLARELIRAAGVPLAAPSANRSGNVSPTRAEHVLAELDGRIDLILDGGPTTGGIESTVVAVSRGSVRLLRPGLVSLAEMEALVGPIARTREVNATGALPSPGMLTRHYAPRTPLELIEGAPWLRLTELLKPGVRIILVVRQADLPTALPPLEHGWGPEIEVMPDAVNDYAARLYAVLHECDERDVNRIVAQMPPETDDWLAVRDRLRRAAAPG